MTFASFSTFDAKINLTIVVALPDVFAVRVTLVKELFTLPQTIYFDIVVEYFPVT